MTSNSFNGFPRSFRVKSVAGRGLITLHSCKFFREVYATHDLRTLKEGQECEELGVVKLVAGRHYVNVANERPTIELGLERVLSLDTTAEYVSYKQQL